MPEYVCVQMWRSEVKVECLFRSLPLFFEMGLLPELEAHRFGQAVCLLSLRDPPVCPPHHPYAISPGATVMPPHTDFYMDTGEPNSGSPACLLTGTF